MERDSTAQHYSAGHDPYSRHAAPHDLRHLFSPYNFPSSFYTQDDDDCVMRLNIFYRRITEEHQRTPEMTSAHKFLRQQTSSLLPEHFQRMAAGAQRAGESWITHKPIPHPPRPPVVRPFVRYSSIYRNCRSHCFPSFTTSTLFFTPSTTFFYITGPWGLGFNNQIVHTASSSRRFPPSCRKRRTRSGSANPMPRGAVSKTTALPPSTTTLSLHTTPQRRRKSSTPIK